MFMQLKKVYSYLGSHSPRDKNPTIKGIVWLHMFSPEGSLGSDTVAPVPVCMWTALAEYTCVCVVHMGCTI